MVHLEQQENVAAHFFWIALPIILSFSVGQLISFKASQKQREKEAEKVASAIVERDKKLSFVLAEHPPHSHGETRKAGQTGRPEPLTTDGLHYPKATFDGEDKN